MEAKMQAPAPEEAAAMAPEAGAPVDEAMPAGLEQALSPLGQ